MVSLVTAMASCKSTLLSEYLRANDVLPLDWVEHPPTLCESHHTTATLHVMLAGVTHLSESDVADVKALWTSITVVNFNDVLTEERLSILLSPPLSEKLSKAVFKALDDNKVCF